MSDMKRVDRIAKDIKYLAVVESSVLNRENLFKDVQFLVDTVKQQNEQIQQIQGNLKPNVIFPELQEVIKQQDEQIKEYKNLLHGSKLMNDEAIDQMEQKDQRIEELEQENARGNGHVKACEEHIGKLQQDNERLENLRFMKVM